MGRYDEAKLLQIAFGYVLNKIGSTKRTQTHRPLSQEAEKGLWAYMNSPLEEQILSERNENMPGDVTFIFGHAHKPFEEGMNFRGYPQWVNVYNTEGG